ncbi:hypothetical protein [Microbacterium sp. No. 7]|uniref:hypothetical protein n=1 Tax=Microbacterium sp. No. 7 TaxID=1714373 RepID=UPI0006D0ECDB|nr:hypothetical protein [Microbacterium sp. No. 7]ALJ22043.1 hypothetical protein AOA12_19965 [Microbacterium sp. No. 7]
MLNHTRLFQTLLTAVGNTHGAGGVAADLDVDTIDHIPFITHSSQAAQNRNGPGLYTVSLDVNIFLDHRETPFSFVQDIYDSIHAWVEHPFDTGTAPGVGAVTSIDNENSAFTRVTAGVHMTNKLVTQWRASWELTAREL